jgi:ribonuclease HII
LGPEPGPAAFDALYRAGAEPLAGTDEAGRGPLAGPLVAAAVILDPGREYPGVTDSKKLSPAARERAYELITARALAWAWADLPAEEVDRLNPLQAAMTAMALAVDKLPLKPALVLVDGHTRPALAGAVKTVVRGDGRSLSIGAASIVAKVVRDRLMLEWHERYPQYGFDRHKGYGTAAHLAALRCHGPCPCHRLSFRGVQPETEAPTADPRHELGRWGEELAARYLEGLGYRVVERNLTNAIGELDLVALDGATVVVVEVKTRRRVERAPAEAVNFRKQRQLTRAASLFLKSRRWLERSARFDVVEVFCPAGAPMQIRHIKNAFEAAGY